MSQVCRDCFLEGIDVYCPNLLGKPEPFRYSQERAAYAYYYKHAESTSLAHITRLAESIRPKYRSVILIGYSAGATLAWKLSEQGLYDGIVCYYGSRIRNHLHVLPRCPSLLIFAKAEASSSSDEILGRLHTKPNVSVYILEGKHGFMNPYTECFNQTSTNIAEQLTKCFLFKYNVKQYK